MPLPILSHHASLSDADLLRLFVRTERLWAEHMGASEQLDIGVAITNGDTPNVWDANRLLEAALPPGMTASDAFAECDRHFSANGASCRGWVIHPAAPASRTAPLIDHLTSLGWRRVADQVMTLAGPMRWDGHGLAGVTILPTRAALRQARELAEMDERWPEPTLADARMVHLDDPHCDSLLALRDGRPIGRVTVFAVGEIGRIDQVYVAPAARRQGVGRLLIGRALEICARSLFKHVMLCVDPENVGAISLYESFGFRTVGQTETYRPPICFAAKPSPAS